MKVKDYWYDLPEELIAQKALLKRDESKLMILNPNNMKILNDKFYNIINYLNKDDVLVINRTKVIPARLIGIKEETNAKIECFLLKRKDLNKWEVLLKPAKRLKIGGILKFSEKLSAKLIEIKNDGNRIMEFIYEGNFESILDEIASMPLPPYIKEKLDDKNRYQTIYANKGESVAAPTAGLHFTNELLEKIKEKGIEILEVYLTVGLGTFRPVQTENIEDHIMHSEEFEIPEETALKINKAKLENRRIIAVGTTSLRALESAVDNEGKLQSIKNNTNIFIYGKYNFKIVDALITNFHLPESTLLMLVSSFAGKEYVFNAYNEAIKNKYRFFSFGDSMFIESVVKNESNNRNFKK